MWSGEKLGKIEKGRAAQKKMETERFHRKVGLQVDPQEWRKEPHSIQDREDLTEQMHNIFIHPTPSVNDNSLLYPSAYLPNWLEGSRDITQGLRFVEIGVPTLPRDQISPIFHEQSSHFYHTHFF